MNPRLILIPLITVMAAVYATSAWAQDKGTVNPKPLPPLANPNDPKIARQGAVRPQGAAGGDADARASASTPMAASRARKALPINGDNWQVMRLSRNRYWGHPDLVALVKRLAAKARKDAGWPGILVGDMSQPRGGPMFTGHASHQVGLDADIWLTPMPNRQLSRNEREEMSAVMMVRTDRLDIDPHAWTPTHLAVIRAAAHGADRAAHLRQCRDQEGAVPRGQGRPLLAPQGAADVRPRLSLPHPHQMPARQPANARASPVRTKAKAAAPAISPTGSAMRSLHPKPPAVPPKPKPPMTMARTAAGLQSGAGTHRTRSHRSAARAFLAAARMR